MNCEIDRQIKELESKADYDRIWRKLKSRLVKHSPRSLQGIPDYSKHDSSDYSRGQFIDTECNEAQIHDYGQMTALLRNLQAKYPTDVTVLSAGKSQGYGGPENALDVWILYMFPTESPSNTAFFIAGHHPELSGPETVYLLAERLLESYHNGNENVKDLRRNTHLVFIPQVDVDLFDNLDLLDGLSQEEYLEKGYSWLLSDPKRSSLLQGHDMNVYITDSGMTEEEYITFRWYRPFAQTIAVKNTVLGAMEDYGEPKLAIDYHESSLSERFSIISDRSSPPYYALAEVSKSYPVQSQLHMEAKARFDREIGIGRLSLLDILSDMGAAGYILETPGRGKVHALEQRIETNLIATDRILARYHLGI